jgi:FecR protein
MKTSKRSVATPMRRTPHLLVVALFALLAIGVAMQARAQGQAAAGDPPGRVARLSDATGKVWLYNPDDNEWVDLDRNRPLTTGDRLATDNGAHAEITLGTTTLRLDEATELQIVQLDDTTYRLHLQNGSVALRMRSPQSLAEFALETDDGQFRVQAVGSYRFDHFDQTSELTVYSGQAVYEGPNSALPLTPGQHAQFWIDAGGVAQYNMVEPARDAFAAWNDERDRAESPPTVAARYVSADMTGANDLDRYGQWQQSPDYGPLWVPGDVPAGWAPYSAGHWAWIQPWGWTWVDVAPWGFAPFHYGRWVNYGNRWCWAPGTYVAHPVYAPALVAWIGGAHVGVSIGIGGPPVGWFPLAPHEVYVPTYRASPRYVREVNITHVTNVTNITTIVNNVNGAADRREFANRKFPNAVTVVPSGVMTSRQAVGPAAALYRGNPQIHALVAEARPGAVLTAPPVATPPPARPVEARAPVAAPPFHERPPGASGARLGSGGGRPPGEARPPAGGRPGGVPGPAVGVAPPVAGAAPRPAVPAPTGAEPRPAPPLSARPAPGVAVPAGGQAPRPEPTDRRPPPTQSRGHEPGGAGGPPRAAAPTSPVPAGAAPAVAATRPPPPRGEPNPPGHAADPHAGQGQARPPTPPRPVEAARSAEPPRAAEPTHNMAAPRPVPEAKAQRVEPPKEASRDAKDVQK